MWRVLCATVRFPRPKNALSDAMPLFDRFASKCKKTATTENSRSSLYKTRAFRRYFFAAGASFAAGAGGVAGAAAPAGCLAATISKSSTSNTNVAPPGMVGGRP